MIKKKYGVVYTPATLSSFVAELLKLASRDEKINVILDPASGECALLSAAKDIFGENKDYIGIDVDYDAVSNTKDAFCIFHDDAILPENRKKKTADYWREILPTVDAIIANPPWSSEKIYDRSDLISAGFSLISGQYDSYVLFLELAYYILRDGGLMAFIIPDSLFDSQNEKLRQFLLENTQIKVIARLGEKIFSEVNRAATVIVCKKAIPETDSETICFRLSTEDRKEHLSGKGDLLTFFDRKKHSVYQNRFINNNMYTFDIDTRSDEEALLDKLTSNTIDWASLFVFGRGVEISKSGRIVYCPQCNYAQGYKKNQLKEGMKICTNCGGQIPVTAGTIQNVISQNPDNGVLIFVGENIRRYSISGENYIMPNIEGINYKNMELYDPPKLLVRKTGLGIYSAIDYSGSMTSQTVYILRFADKNNQTPLEYYLALINSRVVYYYYLKAYGENEWKSHPYLTKQIIFSLPVRPYTDSAIDREIVEKAKELIQRYDHNTDVMLEELIMEKYELTKDEQYLIIKEMNSLPDLSAVNNMKVEA